MRLVLLRKMLMSREERFLRLLKSSARNLNETAIKLVELMENYDQAAAKTEEIKRLEEVGDQLIHDIMRNLHRTFVTPLDREDIALLGERLDDVVDAIEEVARMMAEYGVERPTDRARELAAIIRQSAEVLVKAVEKLQWRGARLREMLIDTVEVNRLENEADQVTSHAIGELFRNAHDPMEVLKWKDIYEELEGATDRAEDVANILEGVVLKHA